jgi:hypothetical protein
VAGTARAAATIAPVINFFLIAHLAPVWIG